MENVFYDILNVGNALVWEEVELRFTRSTRFKVGRDATTPALIMIAIREHIQISVARVRG